MHTKKFKLLLAFIFIELTILSVFILPNLLSRDKNVSKKEVIYVTDKGFNPSNISIPAGTIIQFKNTGEKKHWPASNIHPTHDIYPEFDPKKALLPGQSWEFTFEQAGQWQFHDHLVPTMIGSITVVSSSNQSTEPKQLESITPSFLSSLRFTLQNIYFSFYPQEKVIYISKQNIAQLTEKKDYENLSYIISLVGPERVMTALFEQSGRGEKSNCHIPAHTVGRVSYIALGEHAFQKNITLCSSGYQHGVMSAYIYATGTRNLITRLENVCDKAPSEFAKLTCFHGVGHGLMGYYSNDLPTALDRCMNFNTTSKQNHCMVGVFMENLGAYFGDSITDHPTKWLSTTDMHFPCNVIDQNTQIQRMCYVIQTHWMRIHYKNDFAKIIASCLEAPSEAQISCFSGIGQEAALFVDRKPREIIELCNKVPDRDSYKEQCFLGGVGVILDYWGRDISDQGNRYCALLDSKYQTICKEKVKNRLQDIKLLH